MTRSTAAASSPIIRATSFTTEWPADWIRSLSRINGDENSTMAMKSTIGSATQKLKIGFNQALGSLGYRLVRTDTLERMAAGQSSAAAAVSEAAPVEKPASQPSGLTLRPAANKPPAICTALAPRFDPQKTPSQLADKIVAFQQHGIAMISTNPEKAAGFRETERFDRGVGNLHSSWDWA